MTIAVAAVVTPAAAASVGSASGAVGRYIVVLEPGSAPDAVASEHARKHGAQIGFVYEHALKGYSAVIPEARLAALRADDRVAYVERDGIVTATAQTLPWGINQVDADVSAPWRATARVRSATSTSTSWTPASTRSTGT